MENKVTENPDNWVILKITNNDKVFYKVFGSWVGGYLTGDAWRMNSGISSIIEFDNYYYISGFSGSCYKCNIKTYGIKSTYCNEVLNLIVDNAINVNSEIEIMDANTNWLELKFEL